MSHAIGELSAQLHQGDLKSLARSISIVENGMPEGEVLLSQLQINYGTPVVGFTGPPGAGKSSLVNALLDHLATQGKKIGIIAVDPSSPFNFGALLGDRIRMAGHFNDPNIFIRSLATRGSLGGLSSKIIEVVDVMRAAPFDYLFIETVGVGQSEVEIAGLADTTVVVLVPEAGDEIQTMKAGLMEIADIFVVNKSDRHQAEAFAKNLRLLVHDRPRSDWSVPVLKTIATQGDGIPELLEKIQSHAQTNLVNDRKVHLLANKAMRLIQAYRTRDIDVVQLQEEIAAGLQGEGFNVYNFVRGRYV